MEDRMRKYFVSVIAAGLLLSCGKKDESTSHKIAKYPGSLERFTGSDAEKSLVLNFPKGLYRVVDIPTLGSFYIDSRVDIIKNQLRSQQVWEPEIIALMEKNIKPGTTAIDIGAHIGTHTLSMSKLVGDRGRVVAFEPQLKLYSELVMNMELNQRNNVTAYRCAVGDSYKEIEMNLPVPNNEGGTAIGSGGDSALMITLDSLGLDNVSFMKIDVENLEDDVLRGAEKTIRKNRPTIILEIMGNTYKPDPNRNEKVQNTLKRLQEWGYQTQYIDSSWSDWLATPL